MKQYKVLNPIAHNGERYAADDTVEMPEANGQPLVELGYLEPLSDGALDDDEIIAGIVETLYAVYGDGEKADKKPNVSEVEKWMHRKDITADLRDKAWEAYQSQPPQSISVEGTPPQKDKK